MENEKYLTAKDLMVMLKLGRNSVYELLQLGKIKSIMVGRSYRIAESDVKEFLENNRTPQ